MNALIVCVCCAKIDFLLIAIQGTYYPIARVRAYFAAKALIIELVSD